MSFNRENVIWQSADGTWSRAFYDHYSTGSEYDEDYDSEWDGEYTDKFHWVSTGHPSERAADDSWNGGNPGGGSLYEYTPENADRIAHLDDNAAQTHDAINREQEYRSPYHSGLSYRGPAKIRKLTLIMDDINNAKTQVAKHKLEGYSNYTDPRLPLWQKRVDSVVAQRKPAVLGIVAKKNIEYADKLQKVIDDHLERVNRTSRYGGYSMSAPVRETISLMEKEIAELRSANKIVKQAPVDNAGTESSSVSTPSYHLNPETGRANKCSATKKPCPFGGAAKHYPTKAEARAGYEKSQGGSF